MHLERSSNAPILAVDLGKFNSKCCFSILSPRDHASRPLPAIEGILGGAGRRGVWGEANWKIGQESNWAIWALSGEASVADGLTSGL